MNIKKLTLTGAGMVVAAALAAQPAPAAPYGRAAASRRSPCPKRKPTSPRTRTALCVLSCPPSADPQSLDMTVPGHAVAVSRLREETAAPEGSAVAELRAQLDEARRALLDVDNARADLEARRDYWRRPPVQFADSAPLAGLDELMRQRLQSFGREEADLNRRAEDLNKRIELLTRQIELTGGDAAFTRQAVVELAEPVNGPVTVRYAYSLDNAGWRPVYRLEARPRRGPRRSESGSRTVAAQRRGLDRRAPGAVHRRSPSGHDSAPRLSEWLIRPRPAAPQPAARSANQDAAVRRARSGHDGRCVRPPRARRPRLCIWTARPSNPGTWAPATCPPAPPCACPWSAIPSRPNSPTCCGPRAARGPICRPSSTCPNWRHYPGGEALFLVDGVSVGKAPFSLSGDDSRI